MPNFEILRSCDDVNDERLSLGKIPLYKTTVVHFLTAEEMLELIRDYKLTEWADLAFRLIQEKSFGVD